MPTTSRQPVANTVRDMPAAAARLSSDQSRAGDSCIATSALRRRGCDSPASMPPCTSPLSICRRRIWIITTSNSRFTSACRPQRWVKASSNKVGIGPIPTGFGIEAELTITAPGLPREQLQALVDQAHIVCPYSNATRGNIDVSLVLGD